MERQDSARKLKYARIYASFFSQFSSLASSARCWGERSNKKKKPESEESRYENIKKCHKLY